jgi:hypothetical protein
MKGPLIQAGVVAGHRRAVTTRALVSARRSAERIDQSSRAGELVAASN